MTEGIALRFASGKIHALATPPTNVAPVVTNGLPKSSASLSLATTTSGAPAFAIERGPQAAKTPVPNSTAQQTAKELILQVFESDYAKAGKGAKPDDKRALAVINHAHRAWLWPAPQSGASGRRRAPLGLG